MLDERFWSKVDKCTSSGCWEWTAYRSPKGYGRFSVSAAIGPRFAHRLSFEDANGPIPSGAFILHSCDNPRCVNPSHLRIGNAKDNVADMDDRGRRKHSSLRGEDCSFAKLSEASVREIWRLHLGGHSISEIVAATGCPSGAVYDACRGKTWRHLPDAPTMDQLRRGGVPRGHNQFSRGGSSRELHGRTKVPHSAIPSILERLARGETMASVGASYGVKKAAISKIAKRHS